jgi:signal transduction histidine kinase
LQLKFDPEVKGRYFYLMSNGHKLLLIDADRSRQIALVNLFKPYQIPVTVAVSMEDAYEVLLEGDISYIICDEFNVGQDAFSFCRKIRKSSGLAAIPMMILSSEADQDTIARAYSSGAQAVHNTKHLSSELTTIVLTMLGFKMSDKNKLSSEELDQKQSEFISAVSHELRTPMTSIKSAVGLIGDGTLGPLNDEQREFFQLLERNVYRLTRLIDEILNFSKVDAGRMSLSMNDVNVFAVVDKIKKEFDERLVDSETQIMVNCTDEDIKVFGDAEKMHMVFYYLLDNAINHNVNGTVVEIGVGKLGEKVRLYVKDNGVGIRSDDQKVIFERFHQIDRQVGDGSKGIGFGLSICKGLVEAHGSHLNLNSESGEGSTFFFDMTIV